MAKGIYKRGRIYWVRYAGLDGQTIFESSGSTRFKDAEALLIKRKQGIKEGKQPEVKRITNHTFRELAERYVQWINGRQKSAKSKAYRINTMLSQFGNLSLRRFNTLIIEQYQTDLINKGLENASVNKNVSIIKHMFRKAVEWDMVEEEILKRVKKVKLLPVNNRRLRFLSQDECQKLIKACDPHLKPIVITALNTGMRRGEILNLKWDQVDLRHGFILLSDKDTKNMERREIPINSTLKQTLLKIVPRLDIPYLFYDPRKGKPYKSVRRSFSTACKRAGIKDFKFHDLRHTFSSCLVMSGVDLTTVKELLGHKSLTMTLRYAHLAPSHKVDAVNILDNALNGEKQNGHFKSTIQKLYNPANL